MKEAIRLLLPTAKTAGLSWMNEQKNVVGLPMPLA
jgi:hypothetical protein